MVKLKVQLFSLVISKDVYNFYNYLIFFCKYQLMKYSIKINRCESIKREEENIIVIIIGNVIMYLEFLIGN